MSRETEADHYPSVRAFYALVRFEETVGPVMRWVWPVLALFLFGLGTWLAIRSPEDRLLGALFLAFFLICIQQYFTSMALRGARKVLEASQRPGTLPPGQ